MRLEAPRQRASRGVEVSVAELEDQVFVIALLGRTAPVITELVWHLVVQDGAQIVGLEVWTTANPPRKPQTHLVDTAEALERLRAELPEGALPACTAEGLIRDPPAWNVEPAVRFVAVQADDGSFLQDVADPEDAVRIDAALYERVRELRMTLPDSVQLVGSLAGGRKTMSTALHTAFELQARIPDRLVHVLAHPKFEAALAGKNPVIRDGWPTEAAAKQVEISIDSLVTVVDVPFPLVRWRLPGLEKPLDTLSYEKFWVHFREQAVEGQATGTLRISRQTSVLTVFRPEQPTLEVDLTEVLGLAVRAFVEAPEGLHLIDLRDRVDRWRAAHRVAFSDEDPTPSEDAARAWVKRLRETLHEARVPLHLVPRSMGNMMYQIPGASMITVEVDAPR